MDLTGIGVNTADCMSVGLIVISGLAVLWGIKKAIRMFISSDDFPVMTKGDTARGRYEIRERYIADGLPSDHTYRSPYLK